MSFAADVAQPERSSKVSGEQQMPTGLRNASATEPRTTSTAMEAGASDATLSAASPVRDGETSALRRVLSPSSPPPILRVTALRGQKRSFDSGIASLSAVALSELAPSKNRNLAAGRLAHLSYPVTAVSSSRTGPRHPDEHAVRSGDDSTPIPL